MNNYQLLEVFTFLRRSEIEKCELVSFLFHSIIQQNLHRLPIRFLKAMTVTSEYSEEFSQIPLVLSEKFFQCEKKCWNNRKNDERISPENFIGTRILASIAKDFDKIQLSISPGSDAKCLDIGFSDSDLTLTAPNILADSKIASSILHWIGHFRGCEFESIYLRAALNAELFHLMGVKLICRELNLVTRLYINEFEQVIQFLDDFVQAETISLDFLDVLELDTRNPVMFGNILILRKFILFGVQKCKQSFTLSHCKLDLKFFIGIVQEFHSNKNTKMIPSCKFNFNSSAVPWSELAENNEFKNAQVKKEEESEIVCQNQTYKFQKNTSTKEEDFMEILELKLFFIGDAISAVHLNVKFN